MGELGGGAAIRASGWGWRHATRIRPAVAGLDLDISAGERVLLLGPSGAGKSTVLAGLAGLLDPSEGDEEGELTVAGAHPLERRGLSGLVLQDPQANTILARVGDDVAFGCENLCVPPDETWRRVREALELVGLGGLDLDRSTTALSGGQRQRLALAGILAMRPSLILLDEPTANLDPAGVREVRDAVAKVCEETGATLVVVEHRVETWLPVVNRVVVLEPGGGASADGAPETVLGSAGASLAEAGVWVPGVELPILPRRTWRGTLDMPPTSSRGGASAAVSADAPLLLRADRLAVGRDGLPVGEPVSADVLAGTSTIVTGPNGAGKSTLAVTLAGLLEPVAGSVAAVPSLAPRRSVHPARWRSRELVRRIGMVFQEPAHQFVARTVCEELEFGPRQIGIGGRQLDDISSPLLAELRLEALAQANPFTLSGGEQRRLSVATALATRPAILILDEPTFGQDRATWLALVRLIARLVDEEGRAVVSVTHDADYARALGDVRLELGGDAA